MSNVPHSYSHPNLKDSAAEDPTPEEWDALMAWVRDNPYPDEPPVLDEPFEPEPEDREWFASATLARPALCRPVPPSAQTEEDVPW